MASHPVGGCRPCGRWTSFQQRDLLRLTTTVVRDQHDKWRDGKRRFGQQSMERLLKPDGNSC